MLDDEQEAVLRNPFPSPPSHYQKYTSHNLSLLQILRSRLASEQKGENETSPKLSVDAEEKDDPGQKPPLDVSTEKQQDLLKDQNDVPEWSLCQLEKPRVDWILEDGYYNAFGDTWFTEEKIPSLGELGGQQLYPNDPTIDRRPVLLSILRSMLVTYSHLLKSILQPPPNPLSADPSPPEWQRHVEWLTVMCQNIMSAANDLRPEQARYNLEMMMKKQVELRKEETVALHRKCEELQQKLAELKKKRTSLSVQDESSEHSSNKDLDTKPSLEDVLRWAEGKH